MLRLPPTRHTLKRTHPQGIREVFQAVDFVGISAYVPQKRVDFEPCDMEALMTKMDVEFAYYNLTLRELQAHGARCSGRAPLACATLPTSPYAGVEIHWIEWGVGGGISQSGDQPAQTALQAAYYPFWGAQAAAAAAGVAPGRPWTHTPARIPPTRHLQRLQARA